MSLKPLMDTGKTSRQMFDVIKIKLLLVISLWKVSCFILSGRPIWRLHLKPRWNVISTLGSYWAGRSPGKLARLKKRILTLKSNSLYTSGLVNKLVGAEESRSISRHLEFFVLLFWLCFRVCSHWNSGLYMLFCTIYGEQGPIPCMGINFSHYPFL